LRRSRAANKTVSDLQVWVWLECDDGVSLALLVQHLWMGAKQESSFLV